MKDEDRFPEGATVVVCVRATEPTAFVGNLTGVCVFCGEAVQFRPTSPTPAFYICRPCFAARAEPGDTIHVTSRTYAETLAHWHRN